MNYVHRCRVGKLEGEYVLIYNFFRNLKSTVSQFKPCKLFFAMDGRPKHRYALDSNYKANRIIKLANDERSKTINHVFESAGGIKNLLLCLPTTIIYHPDFEADDIIFSLCCDMPDENIVVISSDSDFTQLLQTHQNCKVYNPIKKQYVENPWYHYIAYKSLVGDKSDNIPSLVSEKAAQALLSNPEKLNSFLNIEENRARFSINRKLIEFVLIELNEENIESGICDFDLLKQSFIKMEFKSLVDDKYWNNFTETFLEISG